MEKRTEAQKEDDSSTRRFVRSRAVLQKALQLNPHSARICQAWGLLELQAGNMWAALALLERASRTDARCAPVSSCACICMSNNPQSFEVQLSE
jgi:lipopolysaccharide biosynthesis regulator YciM